MAQKISNAVTDDYTASTATTGVVTVGSSSSGRIETSDDHDWFKITLQAGTTYQLQATAAGTKGSLYDPVLYLRDSSGTQLAYNDDASSSSLNSLITYTPTSTGTYYLDVASYASGYSGSYSLSATASAPADDYTATSATTGSVTVGSSSTGRIERGSDHDWFKVTLQAGTTYQLQATTTGSSGSLADPVLYLRNSAGTQLAYNDDASTSTANALINYTATSTGTYYLDVAGLSSTQTGTYSLSATATVTDDYTATSATTGSVSVGSSSTGRIERGSDHDWFKVTLQAGTTYQLQATTTGASGSLADPVLYLRNSAGTQLAYNDDASTSTANALINYTATSTGTYYLDVAGLSSTQTGTYSLSATATVTDDYTATSATTGSVSVGVGSSRSGNIERSGDHDWFKVTLQAGTTYQLQAASTGATGSLTDPMLYLRNSAGTELAYNDDASYTTRNALISYTPTSSGIYYLDVAGYSDDTGTYNLSVTAAAPVTDDYSATTATTGTLTVGSSRSGQIETSSDHDWFKVTLQAGTTYQLQATTTGASGSLADPVLYLRNSAGTQLAYNEDASGSTANALITYTPTSTGIYYLDVAGLTASQTGSYSVSASAQTSTSDSSFDIDIVYSGNTAYQTYFEQAASILENIITAGIPDYNSVDDISISASVSSIDGVNGILGQAGPTYIRPDTYLPYRGEMLFDSADISGMISSGTFLDVVTHEMLHVLGMGTIWENLGLNTSFGRYTGANALREYQTLSGNTSATYVPLETDGGEGTANSHWDDDLFGIELMTGYASSSGNMPISRMTIGALEDLGYTVNYAAAETYSIGASSNIILSGVSSATNAAEPLLIV